LYFLLKLRLKLRTDHTLYIHKKLPIIISNNTTKKISWKAISSEALARTTPDTKKKNDSLIH